MKRKLQTTKIFFIVLSVFILGCSLLNEAIATPADADLPQGNQESQPAVTPEEETSGSASSSHPGSYAPFGTYSYEGGVITGTGLGGPYEVEYSGAICSLDQPFTLTELRGTYGELQFTPGGLDAGSVSISGGWMLERSIDNYVDKGNYTVEDNQSDPTILEGNLGLHIITAPDCLHSTDPLAFRTPNQGCFPLDSWIYLSPHETTECSSP